LPIRITEFPLTDEGVRDAKTAQKDLQAYIDKHHGKGGK